MRKSREAESPKYYEIGNKKLPKHSRFSKGKSGNRSGRPKPYLTFPDLMAETAEPAPAIDEADIEIAEPNHVVPVFELGDADEFSDQGLADEDELALPLDLTCVADAANLMIGILPGVLDVG